MITIPEVLLPEHVALDATAKTPEEAVHQVALALRDDERIEDWRKFYDELIGSDLAIAEPGSDFAICIPHARSDAVSEVAMSAARLATGVPSAPGGVPVRFIFVVAVPTAMNADYLRIIGALARIFRDEKVAAKLAAAEDAGSFISLLARKEIAL